MYLYMFGIIPGSVCMTMAGVILSFNKTMIVNTKEMLHVSFRENMLLCFLMGIIGALLIIFLFQERKN
jgi:hypothetical protein